MTAVVSGRARPGVPSVDAGRAVRLIGLLAAPAIAVAGFLVAYGLARQRRSVLETQIS